MAVQGAGLLLSNNFSQIVKAASNDPKASTAGDLLEHFNKKATAGTRDNQHHLEMIHGDSQHLRSIHYIKLYPLLRILQVHVPFNLNQRI